MVKHGHRAPILCACLTCKCHNCVCPVGTCYCRYCEVDSYLQVSDAEIKKATPWRNEWKEPNNNYEQDDDKGDGASPREQEQEGKTKKARRQEGKSNQDQEGKKASPRETTPKTKKESPIKKASPPRRQEGKSTKKASPIKTKKARTRRTQQSRRSKSYYVHVVGKSWRVPATDEKATDSKATSKVRKLDPKHIRSARRFHSCAPRRCQPTRKVTESQEKSDKTEGKVEAAPDRWPVKKREGRPGGLPSYHNMLGDGPVEIVEIGIYSWD